MLYDTIWLVFYPENELVFALYFILLLFFLLPLSFLIVYQSFNALKMDFYLHQFKIGDLVNYSPDNLFSTVKVLVHKKLWFQAITVMELGYAIPAKKIHQYYNAIGFIYDNMLQYDLAQTYYLKAVDHEKSYVIALQNLVKLYFKKKNYSLAVSTCKSILAYDKNNEIAQRYLRNLGS